MSKAIKKNKSHKPKIAIVGLTSCEGCQFCLLDQGEKFFIWLKQTDLADFRLLHEKSQPVEEEFAIVFVEGNPITQNNVELLRSLREHCRWLVVLGNCAALGGVPEIKNYCNKDTLIKKVYRYPQGIDNPKIQEVSDFVKVDLVVPGCPISGSEFLNLARQLLLGKLPKLSQRPVCYECQIRGYDCLLQKGEFCLGSVTLAGCGAVCLKNRQACWGCRGLLDDTGSAKKVTNLLKKLDAEHPRNEINKKLEIFGLRDSWAKRLAEEHLADKK